MARDSFPLPSDILNPSIQMKNPSNQDSKRNVQSDSPVSIFFFVQAREYWLLGKTFGIFEFFFTLENFTR